MLSAMGIKLSREELLSLAPNEVTWPQMWEICTQHRYAQWQRGRYFVALSLFEAECVRRILHQRQWDPVPLLGAGLVNALLEIHSGLVLAKSPQYKPAPRTMLETAQQCLRFVNCETHFGEDEVCSLIRALQRNPPPSRVSFFEEVRACRRRAQIDWKKTAIAPVLSCTDASQVYVVRSLISAFYRRIFIRGLRLLDAFKAFDHNGDGLLSCSELYGAFKWLGLSVEPDDILAFMSHLAKSGQGRLRWQDFEDAVFKLEWYSEEVEKATVASLSPEEAAAKARKEVKPIKMKELFAGAGDEEAKLEALAKAAEIDESALRHLLVDQKPVLGWTKCVWDSKGTGSSEKVSLWNPDLTPRFVKRNVSVRICVGQYATLGYSQPPVEGSGSSLFSWGGVFGGQSKDDDQKFMMLQKRTIQVPLFCRVASFHPDAFQYFPGQLTDRSSSRLRSSDVLSVPHVNWLCPFPIRFKVVSPRPYVL